MSTRFILIPGAENPQVMESLREQVGAEIVSLECFSKGGESLLDSFSWQEAIQELRSKIHAQSGEEIVLVGHSLGSLFALELADLAKRVVLLCPSFNINHWVAKLHLAMVKMGISCPELFLRIFARVLFPSGKVSVFDFYGKLAGNGGSDEWKKLVFRNWPSSFVAKLLHGRQHAWSLIRKYQSKIVVIEANGDKLCPPMCSYHGVNSMVLTGSHFLPMESAAELVEVISV